MFILEMIEKASYWLSLPRWVNKQSCDSPVRQQIEFPRIGVFVSIVHTGYRKMSVESNEDRGVDGELL